MLSAMRVAARDEVREAWTPWWKCPPSLPPRLLQGPWAGAGRGWGHALFSRLNQGVPRTAVLWILPGAGQSSTRCWERLGFSGVGCLL